MDISNIHSNLCGVPLDLSNKIYFKYISLERMERVMSWVWKLKNSNSNIRFIAIKVDPDTTYVYNNGLLYNKNAYANGKITLRSFIDREPEWSHVNDEWSHVNDEWSHVNDEWFYVNDEWSNAHEIFFNVSHIGFSQLVK